MRMGRCAAAKGAIAGAMAGDEAEDRTIYVGCQGREPVVVQCRYVLVNPIPVEEWDVIAGDLNGSNLRRVH